MDHWKQYFQSLLPNGEEMELQEPEVETTDNQETEQHSERNNITKRTN